MIFAKSLSFLIIALILQLTVIKIISIGSIKPDLILIVLIGISLRFGSLVGVYSGLAIGIIQDVYAIETLGANALAKCLVGYTVGLFDERVLKIVPVTKVFFLAMAFTVHEIVYCLSAGWDSRIILDFLFHRSLPSGIYTMLIGSLAFYTLVAPTKSEA